MLLPGQFKPILQKCKKSIASDYKNIQVSMVNGARILLFQTKLLCLILNLRLG